MDTVNIYESKIIIPTYPEPEKEELPMFAENRVHQRTSGRPYPNKVVMQVNRETKIDKEYKLVTLENEYVKIEILPEIGGRIYSAYDKTTGYDYFYKQHVIKPALIGVLGSWISGGVEFNWPFHHRASGFMPCDFTLENLPDGSAACHLSEHDPIDRMKGMVSVILKPDATFLETRMRLYNRTTSDKSFLWWENAAVPVNESYQIFFPPDVSYVNFHYLKSRTTYPLAGNGVYNGIPMEEERDISWHKNTRQATSYFACASDYDYFGGYDHSKECGVIHIGDHNISPGKKMFTWAYCQLAKSWENALTDTDGQYAELMAGSYSDNQPDFSWLSPYETKEFSQYWYPISKIGAPSFANINCAFNLDRDNNTLKIQSTKEFENVSIQIYDGKIEYLNHICNLDPKNYLEIKLPTLPSIYTVIIKSGDEIIAEYTETKRGNCNMPEVISDMPSAESMNDPDELYLSGLHVKQYRDPHTNPDSFWKEALKRKKNHVPSLIAMADYELSLYNLESAENYIKKAIEYVTIYNERVKSGEAYYVYAKILEAKGEMYEAYKYYYKASFASDCTAKAMTKIALIDIKRKSYLEAARHAENALDYGRNNNLALSTLVIALRELNKHTEAELILDNQLNRDNLDHLNRFLKNNKELYSIMDSNPSETCLDIIFDLSSMGRYEDIIAIIEGLISTNKADKMLYYTLGYYKSLIGENPDSYYKKATEIKLGAVYPSRFEEKIILEDVINKTNNSEAKMLLGCLLYNKLQYEKAAKLWLECSDYISKRNLAVAYFSHLNKPSEALKLMKEVLSDRPNDEELLYETLCLMNKMGIKPCDKIDLIKSKKVTRDDILTELSKAYNQNSEPDKALETLLSHNFTPCEGGEHAIADQYMFAYLLKGKTELDKGNYHKAIEYLKKGQTLPQSLGAGIWSHCKLVPLKFYEAICLKNIGETEKANEILKYISSIKIEYFSNMHLKELPYFQARSYELLGENVKAQHLMSKYMREWGKIKDIKENGYFGTTPFFISFIEKPEKLRLSQYYYLSGLCEDYLGNKTKASEYLKESVKLNSENMLAIFFNKIFS